MIGASVPIVALLCRGYELDRLAINGPMRYEQRARPGIDKSTRKPQRSQLREPTTDGQETDLTAQRLRLDLDGIGGLADALVIVSEASLAARRFGWRNVITAAKAGITKVYFTNLMTHEPPNWNLSFSPLLLGCRRGRQMRGPVQ
jgi:hypothetical protein